MFMLELTALFRSFCFFLSHLKTASLALAAARQSAQPAYRLSSITPQKIARPLLRLMHASDESQLPGLPDKRKLRQLPESIAPRIRSAFPNIRRD
jgi:hypothetical protein